MAQYKVTKQVIVNDVTQKVGNVVELSDDTIKKFEARWGVGYFEEVADVEEAEEVKETPKKTTAKKEVKGE